MKRPNPRWEHLTAFLQEPGLFDSSVSASRIYILAWMRIMVWNDDYIFQGDYDRVTADVYVCWFQNSYESS